MATVKVDKNNFQSDVLEAEGPVVVDFWAEWCGPCRKVSPLLEEIAGEMKDQVTIVKLNIDENPETARAYRVMSVPTLTIFKNGQGSWSSSSSRRSEPYRHRRNPRHHARWGGLRLS